MSTKSAKVDTDVPKDRRGLLRSEDCIEARQMSGDFDVYKICCSADMVAAKNRVQRALRLFLRDQGNLRDKQKPPSPAWDGGFYGRFAERLG